MIVETRKVKKFKNWQCGGCTKLLGIVHDTGIISIKYKDMLLWVKGEVTTICRFCQTSNTYRDIDCLKIL